MPWKKTMEWEDGGDPLLLLLVVNYTFGEAAKVRRRVSLLRRAWLAMPLGP